MALTPPIAENESLYAGAGDDTAQGCIGTDTVFGGHGDDLVRGGEQHDILFGGAGAQPARQPPKPSQTHSQTRRPEAVA